MKALSITELVAARIAAKRAEDAAVSERRRIDEQISLQLSTGKTEGTESRKLEDLGVKVTVTYSVTRKVDTKKLTADWEKMSAVAQSAFRWKAEVAITELKTLEGGDAAVAASYITSKPASPQVKIEAV